MKQVAALEAVIQQYNQINQIMPQLSAEISTMQWLYSVLNRGEGVMAAMNMNVPIRATGGGMEPDGHGTSGKRAFELDLLDPEQLERLLRLSYTEQNAHADATKLANQNQFQKPAKKRKQVEADVDTASSVSDMTNQIFGEP